jgi:3',5'-cyclic AMP phosphodiesterase CpdA
MRSRALIVAAAAIALALTTILLSSFGAHPAAPVPGSTLQRTLVDRDGDGFLERGPGEALRNRTDLAPASRTDRTLATFVQISDVHLADEESPARPVFLDRLGSPFESTFRPQEALGGQILAQTVTTVNRLRPEAVVLTGDLVDNAQDNELRQALAILDGGRVDPDSGRRGYAGAQSQSNPDPFYYRPDVDAPRHPGLLARAERPFVSAGLRAPWYPVLGNHDLLVQGELAPRPTTNAVAVGSRLLLEADRPAGLPTTERGLSARLVDRVLSRGLPGRAVRVAPDPARRELPAGDVLGRLRSAAGHGGSGPRLDYSFDIGPRVRAIVLDAVSRTGGAGGRIPRSRLPWLRAQLAAADGRWIVVFSHQPLATCKGGRAALALLDRDPHVVAAIAGHTHRNSIVVRRSPSRGYWLVTTASLIDYPQQARAFRLVALRDGGVALETWMIDHGDGQDAGVARELSFLDVQGGRARGDAGGPRDRNARLFR